MTTRGSLLITGASGGIGLATTLAAARAGWNVHAAVRVPDNIAVVQAAATNAGVQVTIEVLDVTDALACEEVVARVQPRILINNAGLGTAGAIEETDIEVGRNQLEVMAVAPMRLSQLAVPFMRAQGGGHIVNISSLGGLTSSPLTGWYVGSKHALEGLTDALRMEVARDRISVSLVEPGGVNTGILEKAVNATEPYENSKFTKGYKRAQMLMNISQHVQGNPERVAKVVMKALDSSSPRSRYIVGLDARLLLLAGTLFPSRLKDRVKRKVLAI